VDDIIFNFKLMFCGTQDINRSFIINPLTSKTRNQNPHFEWAGHFSPHILNEVQTQDTYSDRILLGEKPNKKLVFTRYKLFSIQTCRL